MSGNSMRVGQFKQALQSIPDDAEILVLIEDEDLLAEVLGCRYFMEDNTLVFSILEGAEEDEDEIEEETVIRQQADFEANRAAIDVPFSVVEPPPESKHVVKYGRPTVSKK